MVVQSQSLPRAEATHNSITRICDRYDDCRSFFFIFSTKLGLTWPTSRFFLALRLFLCFLSFFFSCLQCVFQIPGESRTKRRVVSSEERFPLKTFTASAEGLRLDIHQSILHWKQD